MWELWHALMPAGEARLSALGLSLRGFIALGHLQAGPRQPAELATQLGLPRYEMSRLLRELERGGLLRRERGTAHDGRRVRVQATDAGRERWRQGLGAVEAVTAPRLAALDPDDLARLTAALRAAAHAPTQGEP